ncbi:MAG: hypothetical protein GX330_04815 [Bacteroidales bacterium]|nr:hypothetical protein [Bacteroidales bacterium]
MKCSEIPHCGKRQNVSANAMMTDTKDIELEAACSLTERQAREILARDNSWLDKIIGGNNDIKFSFNQYDLISYLRQRPELCEKILQFSYDKRCSPATFIEEHENAYRVGWFDKDREKTKTFDKLYEAATDFVLFSWNLGRLEREEYRLPKKIRERAIESGNEFGWKQQDFKNVVEAARQVPMAVVGGQVQYVFNDGICELYWLSYDPDERQENEDWIAYCNRTANQVNQKFDKLIIQTDFEREAQTFEFLKEKKNKGVDIDEHKIFIIYFNDNETDLWTK